MISIGPVLRASLGVSLVGLTAALLAVGDPSGCGRLCEPAFWGNATSIVDVEAELQAGADVNGQRPSLGLDNPLHLAIASGAGAPVVELMLRRGADPNASDSFLFITFTGDEWEVRRTPLQEAVDPGPFGRSSTPDTVDIVRLLLTHGADPNPPTDHDNPYSESPLSYALWLPYEEGRVIIELLLEHGADISARDYDGLTPFHHAVFYEADPAFIELLLDYGADIHARTDSGNIISPDLSSATPLHWAVFRSSPEVIALLIDRGADVAAQNELGQTPCQMARERDRPEEVLQLVCS